MNHDNNHGLRGLDAQMVYYRLPAPMGQTRSLLLHYPVYVR
jgi:hypothetical protein